MEAPAITKLERLRVSECNAWHVGITIITFTNSLLNSKFVRGILQYSRRMEARK